MPHLEGEILSAEIPIFVDNLPVSALVDTGADYSVMNGSLAAQLRKVTTQWNGPQIRTAGGHMVEPIGMCTARVEIRGVTFPGSFVVLRECSKQLILGLDFLREYGAIINLRELLVTFSTPRSVDEDSGQTRPTLRICDENVTLPPRASMFVTVECDRPPAQAGIAEQNMSLLLTRQVCAARGLVDFHNGRTEILVTNFSREHQHLPHKTAVAYLDEVCDGQNLSTLATLSAQTEPGKPSKIDMNPHLTVSQREQLLHVIDSFGDCFALTSKVRQTTTAKHRIITDENERPVHQRPYRVSATEREVICRQVKEMLQDDVIQPSRSPWASPVVLVEKKDGTLRFCVDYRKLNKITKKDVYPLPRIDDSLDRLRNARYFSSLDLRSGYWQIEVDERDREKTAFITPDGLYEFKVLPFGLCSAPATFQRMMDTVLGGLKWKSCLVYLDDVVVFSETFEEHLVRLREIFEAIRSAQLSLKPEKCHFAYEELKFLGHVVSYEGVRPDPDKTAAVASFPIPTDKKTIRRFLGLCAYYRRFVSTYSSIAEPLTRLTRDSVPFHWGPEQSAAFEDLKNRLQSPPILGHFDEDADTELHTDASNVGLGAVLVQWQDNKERVIAYASRTLSPAETNYSTTEKECLAVVWAVTKLRPYLYGRPFKVVTDHHSLCWLANLKDPAGRLARWSLRLQEFDVTIMYKSGHKHSDADCLSRAPVNHNSTDEDGDAGFLGAVTPSDLAEEQRNDVELRPLIDYLEGRIPRPPKPFARGSASFCLRNDVLYKENFGPTETPYLLVAPNVLRQEILQACHDEPSSGHLGFTRTLARIRQRYYWPRLAQSVKRYVRSCRDCQRRKTPPSKPPGFLQPVDPPKAPFQQVGMDLLGPFPLSSLGNRWIVVATDYLTRYCETKALPRGTAAEVARFFIENIVLRHGAPTVVITDRGKAFTAQLIEEVLQLSCTSHRRTTAYHPQANGLTERLNKTIADMLSMYVDVDHRNWNSVLPYVTFAYNTAAQETTRFSPFRLVHGREVLTMLDSMLLPDECRETMSDDAEEITQRAEATRQIARQRIRYQQASDARRYNLRHRNVTYAPGEQVWVWSPVRRQGHSEKLMRRYFGPYKVIRRTSDVNYEVLPEGAVRSPRSITRSEVVHVSRMKPYYSR